MREPGWRALPLLAVAFIALAIPIWVRWLLHSRLPLPWVLLPVALTVAARLLDHRLGRSRPWVGTLSSLATFGFAAMLIGLVVITPYSAYRVWFDSVLLGSPRGAVSNVFVLATAFFSSLLSPALLTMGPAWTLLVLGLSVLYLLGMILPSPLVFLVILAGAAGSLALLAARTRGIGSGRASFTILLFLLSVGLAFLLAGDRRPQGSRLIDRVVYPGLRDLAVSAFPGFPLVYEIPGYGYSFNEKRLGGRPALSDNPIFTVEGRPGETLYLRTRIFDLYDGRSWKAALPEFEFPRLRAAWRVFSSRFSGGHNLRLTLEADFYNSLPHTLDTYHVNLAGGAGEGPGRSPSTGPRLIPQGDLETGYRLEPPLQHGDTILVAHGEVPPGAFPRRSPWNAPPAAPLELSVSQRAAYLQLPEELPVELRRLAWRLAGGRTEPQEVLRSIQRFLESNYIYNLNPREPRQARDFVAGFLFDGDSSGYCVHFASSLIVLARLNGIPARYATGFLAIIPSTTDRATVTGMAAHAWPEVWLEGRGWVTWEATTAVDPTAWQRTAGELIYSYHLASDPLTARQIASLMGAPEGTALMGEGGGAAPPAAAARSAPSIPPAWSTVLPAAALLLLAAGFLLRGPLLALWPARRQALAWRLERALHRLRRCGLPDPRTSGWLAWFGELERRAPALADRVPALQAAVLARAYGPAAPPGAAGADGAEAETRAAAEVLGRIEALARELPRTGRQGS